MSAPETGQCDLCRRPIDAWEWDERWHGRAEAQVFASARDPEEAGWLMLRCSHCAARTLVTEGGES